MDTLHHLPPGSVFGRDFQIVAPLRSGGMGTVYIAHQLSTGKQRALKVMARELALDAAARERFVLEARVGAHIDSDHVVEVVTAGVDEQTQAPYLVMELLKGEELADVIERLGPLPLGDVAEVLSQAGHALQCAHEKGIVHRDLKPENLFLAVSRRLDSTFTLKILDFGIAKIVADQKQQGTQPLGTPLYMSPEQTDRGGRITPASDVWAMGLIVFRLLTGHEFWRATDGSLALLLREIVIDPIPLASERARELGVLELLPPGFDAWFAQAVTRDLGARFKDAGALTRAFAALAPRSAPRGLLAKAISPQVSQTLPENSPQTVTAEPVLANADRTAPAVQGGTAPGGTLQGGTMASAATRNQRAARSPLPLLALGAGALALIGAGVLYFVSRGPGEAPSLPSSASALASAPPPPAPSAAPPAPAACPEGMVRIEGGNMFMGTRAGEGNASPAHRVTVSTFCLDRTEVTAAAYEQCAASGNCLRALQDVDFPGITPKQRAAFKQLCNVGQTERQQHPVNCVDFSMADNFCRTAGGRLKDGGARLPSEAEWEFAARGSGQRTYPWGDEEPDATRLNACGTECKTWMLEHRQTFELMYAADDGHAGTAPVGSFPAGASQAGILDLAGNVWEWTADWFAPYTAEPETDPRGPSTGTERVVRGGAFNGFMADWAKPSYRWKTAPTVYNHAIGFRCAFSPVASDR